MMVEMSNICTYFTDNLTVCRDVSSALNNLPLTAPARWRILPADSGHATVVVDKTVSEESHYMKRSQLKVEE